MGTLSQQLAWAPEPQEALPVWACREARGLIWVLLVFECHPLEVACCMWLQNPRLEEALKEVANSSGRTVLVPQRARGALKSWPAERSLLHQSAAALCEAIMVQGPQHLRRRELGASWQVIVVEHGMAP